MDHVGSQNTNQVLLHICPDSFCILSLVPYEALYFLLQRITLHAWKLAFILDCFYVIIMVKFYVP